MYKNNKHDSGFSTQISIFNKFYTKLSQKYFACCEEGGLPLHKIQCGKLTSKYCWGIRQTYKVTKFNKCHFQWKRAMWHSSYCCTFKVAILSLMVFSFSEQLGSVSSITAASSANHAMSPAASSLTLLWSKTSSSSVLICLCRVSWIASCFCWTKKFKQ